MMDDKEAIRRDHGVGMGVYVNPVDKYTGPIHDSSDSEVAKREHGAGIGVPADGMITYGTRDQELQDVVNNLTHSNGVQNLESVISKLPDEAIIRVIQLRYRNVVTRLQDRRGLYSDVLQELSKDITLDLNIIRIALQQRRNLFEKSFNASIYVGQDNEQNIIGLLEEYQRELEQVMISIPLTDGATNMPVINPTTNQPYEAYNYADEVKEEAKTIAVEMGIDIGGKSM